MPFGAGCRGDGIGGNDSLYLPDSGGVDPRTDAGRVALPGRSWLRGALPPPSWQVNMQILSPDAVFLAGFLLLAYFRYRRGRTGAAIVTAGLGVWLARYFSPLRDWLDGLGQDSLAEAQKFACSEAWFFLQTLGSAFSPLNWSHSLVLVAMGTATAVVTTGILWWALGRIRHLEVHRWFDRSIGLSACLFVAVPIGQQMNDVRHEFRSNSDIYEGVRRQFADNETGLKLVPDGYRGMRVIVYIGESTTAMHWGLYGYPGNTTPGLSAFAKAQPGFLKFDHVVSTHTLTSQSLLEALSIGLPGELEHRPITERRRASLVGVLNRIDVPTLLLSTQEATGVWNLVSSIVFSRATSREYASPAGASLGATTGKARVWDDVYFGNAPERLRAFRPGGTAIAFLHSQAGHGGYAENIPGSARLPPEPFFEEAAPHLVYGDLQFNSAGYSNLYSRAQALIGPLLLRLGYLPGGSNVDDYDNAMRYVDSTLTRLLQQVAEEEDPTVVVYFSDHGESALTRAGHDSSRFQHEMIRVPFLVYFNGAARQASPGLFAEFQAAARAGRRSSLAQVPATITKLLGYRIAGAVHDYRGIGLDPEDVLPPMVVRRLANETTYVRSRGVARERRRDARDATDRATTIWLNRKTGAPGIDRPALCYGDANTWGKANRGATVADCLELRLATDGGQLDAAPVVQATQGWVLRAVAQVAAAHRMPLWLDGSQLSAGQACAGLQAWRQEFASATDDGEIRTLPANDLVLEVVSEAESPLPPACAALQAQGISLFLRVPDPVASDEALAATWRRSMASGGWPAHYSLQSRPDAKVMKDLLSVSGARWVLGGVSVDELPWQGTASVPGPEMLRIGTDWDPNSRV